MLGHFQIGMTGYIQNVPVCADYCDAWFDACKDDLTCVEDWLADFDYAIDGNNSCPANSTCVTFREMYGNGEGLCNRMWGTAFHYSTDTDNCTVMAFNNSMPNPNYRLTFPRASMPTTESRIQVTFGSIPRSGSTSTLMLDSVVMYGSLLLMSLLTAAAI